MQEADVVLLVTTRQPDAFRWLGAMCTNRKLMKKCIIVVTKIDRFQSQNAFSNYTGLSQVEESHQMARFIKQESHALLNEKPLPEAISLGAQVIFVSNTEFQGKHQYGSPHVLSPRDTGIATMVEELGSRLLAKQKDGRAEGKGGE